MGFGDALQGAAGGALGGAGAGFGVPGALIGGGLGFLGGLFGGGGRDPRQEEIYKRLLAMSGPMGPAGQAGQSDQRGRQISYLDTLKALSEGKGPSVSREILRDSMAKAEAGQATAAASAVGRGVGAGGAYRNAASTMSSMQGDASRVGAITGAQEQLGALSMYGQHIAGTRGQDESLGMFNTDQANQYAMMQRRLQLEALSRASGAGMAGAQPSMGERILAGGAGVYGLMGGRGHTPGRQPGQFGPAQWGPMPEAPQGPATTPNNVGYYG